eukprot:363803-Chlamydomonas_euryale.AAC.2
MRTHLQELVAVVALRWRCTHGVRPSRRHYHGAASAAAPTCAAALEIEQLVCAGALGTGTAATSLRDGRRAGSSTADPGDTSISSASSRLPACESMQST